MSATHRLYEIRCPVFGFIKLTDWEREIISQPAFQRLRRIRQLAWTDYIYPGAMHTRFEHSLGVMHMATLLYDNIVERSESLLSRELGYARQGLERNRVLVRLAALLHDVGHAPFSHASEDLLPLRDDNGQPYRHEQYSAAIVRQCFADVIRGHRLNTNCGFTAEDVAALLDGSSTSKSSLFWRDLIDGQIDADRMDYLLRDSLHTGVGYGRYDWQRLVATVQAIPGTENSGPRVGVSEGGWHAVEGLILARYFMFTQVYFHKTRVAFDHHLKHALAEMLPGGQFPPPTSSGIRAFLEWDDWRVLGLLREGEGGEHGRRLAERDHFREVIHTTEMPTGEELRALQQWKRALGDLLAAEERAEKSWYKIGMPDVQVASEVKEGEVESLSRYSSFVAKMEPIGKVLLFVRPEDFRKARQLLSQERGTVRSSMKDRRPVAG